MPLPTMYGHMKQKKKSQENLDMPTIRHITYYGMPYILRNATMKGVVNTR